MKILSTVFVFIISISLFGCTSGNEVSGRSIKSANRSVNRIKDRLPVEKRIEFEVSYWTLRDSIKTRDEFLDTVGGKTPEGLIELGKGVFQQRKSTGFKGYDQYSTWEQMIAQFTQERMNQSKPKKPKNKTQGGNSNNILYNL